MREYNVSGIPIVEGGRATWTRRRPAPARDVATATAKTGRLVGIMTRRDLKFQEDDNRRIGDVMTQENLVTAPENTTLDEAERILYKAKVEKLLLVDKDSRLAGLITMRDIDKLHQFPNACKDKRGRLRVGAATGVKDFARVEALIKADVDVVVVDTAHGHSKNVLDTVREIKKNWNDPGDRRQRRDGGGGEGSDRRGGGCGEGRHRAGGDLHDADHQRRRRAADHGDLRGVERGGAGGRAGHRRRRHSPQRRHHQGHRRRGELRDDGQPLRRAGRSPGRTGDLPGPAV